MSFVARLFNNWKRKTHYIQEKCPECNSTPMILKSDKERASYKVPSSIGLVRQVTLKRVIAHCTTCKKDWEKAEVIETKYDNFDDDVPFYPKLKEWAA